MKKLGPVAYSLFLEDIMTSSGLPSGQHFIGEKLHSTKLSQLLSKTTNERTQLSIQESRVLIQKEPAGWNWDLISAVFKWPGDAFISLESNAHKQFLRSVVEFYKPATNKFTKLEVGTLRSKQVAKIGCNVLDFLLKNKTVTSLTNLVTHQAPYRVFYVSRTDGWTPCMKTMKPISSGMT